MADNSNNQNQPSSSGDQSSGSSNLNRLFQTAGTQNQQQGTGYTNLNRLFNANQNNQLGTKVASNIQGQIGNVQNQLGQQQSDFNTQSQANRLDTDANKANANAVIGRFSSASGDSSTAQPTEQDVNNFQKYTSGTYSGPTGLADTGTLANTASQLKQQTSAFDPSSTQDLLRRTVGGGGDYTQGQQRLDSLLLDRSNLRPVQREASALTGQVNQAGLAANNQAQQYSNAAQAFGADVKNQLQGALGGLDTAATQQLTAAQQAEAQRQASIQAIQNFAAGKAYDTNFTPDANAKTVTNADGTKTVTNPSTGDIATYNSDGSVKQVTDQYGATKYNTDVNSVRGAANQYGQLSNLQSLLGKSGVSQSNIDALFGTGDINQRNEQQASATQNAYQSALGNYLQGQAAGTIGKAYNAQTGQYDPTYFDNSGTDASVYSPAIQYLNSGADANLSQAQRQANAYQMMNGTLNAGQQLTGPEAQGGAGAAYNQALAAANQGLYANEGIAGQITQNGETPQFYQNLATLVGNSSGPQNLTKAGVASDTIKNNYAALSRLLGSNTNPYANAGTYQAGGVTIDPTQLKAALGLS